MDFDVHFIIKYNKSYAYTTTLVISPNRDYCVFKQLFVKSEVDKKTFEKDINFILGLSAHI